jgi:glucans biosynthesis protein C
MMWLGIVLHVSLQHMVEPSAFTWRDPATSRYADALVWFIHCFRMPEFFILAGFFAALLVQRQGLGGMLRHRLLRIGLPFVLFLPPLTAGVVYLGMGFTHLQYTGVWGIDPSLMPQARPGQPTVSTLHLWFMYLLVWFALFTALLGWVAPFVPQGVRNVIAAAFRRLGAAPWGFAALALPLAWAGASHPSGVVSASGYFMPPLSEWFHNALFFAFGWYMHRAQEELLALYARRAWLNTGAGALFFGAWMVLAERMTAPAALAYAYNCAAWLWCFALIGLFMRYVGRPSRVLRYAAESSYWVYLIHMLGVIGFGALIYPLDWGVAAKIALNVALTTAAGLLTYQLLVRHTPLGWLLNGRKKSQPVNHL